MTAPWKTAALDAIVVMGVAGCGKSLIAQELADALSSDFIEADTFHSLENAAIMRAGRGLTDEQRWPWLRAVCQAARESCSRPPVIACSALKRHYRDFMRSELGNITFVHLDGSEDLIERRIAARTDHFATQSLLESQFRTLEPLHADERGCRISIECSPAGILHEILVHLGTG